MSRISPLEPVVTWHPRFIDLDALRAYLRAVAHVAWYAATCPDPCELLAAVKILRRDLPRGLAALEGRS